METPTETDDCAGCEVCRDTPTATEGPCPGCPCCRLVENAERRRYRLLPC